MSANSSRRNEQERVIKEALVQIFALQMRQGKSTEVVNQGARKCILDAAKAVQISRAGNDDSGVQRFGSLLRTWHRETRYLSDEGFPRSLGVEGKHGLKGLICSQYPKDQFSTIFRALKNAGLIKQDKKGKWFPTTRHAVFPTLSAELLVHFSEGVARFIETMTRNVTARNKSEVLFERSSKVQKLPISKAGEFRNFVNAQALTFLEAVDDWLESHVEEGKSSRERKCSAGVFAFAFLDELQRSKKGLS
jgi:hypothetical protein